ncbi:MAG TPA: hypothetical protein ENI94_11885 [Gammaproteobacteria bacterium]|nr:hypothetical protein [Gammaproteobacteria bacterium]
MRSVEKTGLWLTVMLAGVLAGCASMPGGESGVEPEVTEDGSMTAVEGSVAETPAKKIVEPLLRSSTLALAEARGDIDAAMADVRMAEARNMPQPEASSKLQQAREAVDAGDATLARKLAGEAGAHVRAALDGHYAGMAQQRVALLRDEYSGKMSSTQRMRLDSAQSALKAGQPEVALMLVNALVGEVAPDAIFKPPAASDGKLAQVTVREGDTLSAIAARPEVYGNANLWPLLLKANRDKLPRADKVPVGVELVIPRNASPEEIKEALAQAR